MLYAILKILARLTIWGYFRRIKIIGREHIPKNGPYIFVANHPSAFMDPIVVGTSVRPAVHFIAAGEYVGKGLKGWLFQKLFHSIPVYRPTTQPGETHKNKDMFEKCHEHLLKKGALVIFPEGVSLTEKKLKPLKTGTVRIAIGAEELRDFNLGVPIIPIGLNYSDPHEFRSDLFVKIGAPIYVKDHITAEENKEKETQIKITKAVTELLQEKMQETILHLHTDHDEALLEKLETIFARDVKAQFNIDYYDLESEFEMQKNFIEAINYSRNKSPELFRKTEEKVDHYITELEKNDLTDKDIGEFESRYHYYRIFSFVFGLPFFLFGLIHNFTPYKAVGFFTRKIKMDRTFEGSMSLAFGMGLFLIWYVALSWIVGYFWLGLYALLYPILMYSTGLYALIYATAIEQSIQRKKLRTLFKTNKELLRDLILQRREIVAVITAYQKEYLENHS